MTEPKITGFLIGGLFWATEQIWKKGSEKFWDKGFDAVVDASLAPGSEGLKERFKNWAGQGQEVQRRKAFLEAITRARLVTVRQAENPEEAGRILKILDDKLDQRSAQMFTQEATKLMLFSATPDLHRLEVLCQERLYWESLESYELRPSSSAVAQTLYDFLTNLKEALLDEEPYQNLIQKEVLRTLREVVAELRPVEYDDEATYRSQLVSMYRELEFVGIPELKERRPLTIEDVFIRLRTEQKLNLLTALDETPILNSEKQRELPELGKREESTLDEMLGSSLRTVVLGDPGAGKTTLLKFLTVVCADHRSEVEVGLKTIGGKAPLPIFVSLRAFASEATKRDEDYSLLNYFYTHAKEHLLLNLKPGFFEEALEQERCLICLDGLDEIWAIGNRAMVRDAVKALASRFKHNRFLVTSRIVGYEEAPLDSREFAHHTVLPLLDEDIRSFVTKWYKLRERDPVKRQEQINNLISTIEREERIKTLAQNPLLLTIIALVHRIEAELPQERVKLYDKCVTALVDTWEEVKGLSIDEKKRPFYSCRRRLLERLAYDLHTRAEEPGQVRSIKEGDLELRLTRFLMEIKSLDLAEDSGTAHSEAQAFVRLVRGRTGLLIEKGESVFSFPHLTFQEYLTACDIEKRCIHRGVDAIWQEIKDNLHDSHWREVILLLLGSLNRYDELPTLLVERILETGQSDRLEPLLHRCLYLAARAMSDRVEVDASLYRQVINQLLDLIRNTPSWVRRRALEMLVNLGQKQLIAAELTSLAQDSQLDAEVRRSAASSLGRLGQTEVAIEALQSLIQDSQLDAEVRRSAASNLGELGQTEVAIEALQSLAQNPQLDANIRRSAASSLGELGRTEVAIEVLQSLIQDPQLRSSQLSHAAYTLGKLGQKETAVEVLVKLLSSDSKNQFAYIWLNRLCNDTVVEPLLV